MRKKAEEEKNEWEKGRECKVHARKYQLWRKTEKKNGVGSFPFIHKAVVLRREREREREKGTWGVVEAVLFFSFLLLEE